MTPAIKLGWTDERRPSKFRQSGRGTLISLLLACATLWLICYFHYKSASARDPTSYFFDEAKGYDRTYSLKRAEQADSYLEGVNRKDVQPPKAYTEDELSSARRLMCVGVATIARPEQQYVSQCIGSLLEGLSAIERSEIFLILFIAHTDPSVHPIYHEPWTEKVADQILTYNVSTEEMSQLRLFEEEHHPRNKSMFDYGYLLENCQRTGAQWSTILEDDVIARDGWYNQARQSLQEIGRRMKNDDWLYMRMFYTESLLGWNNDEWPTYVALSLLVMISLQISLHILRRHSSLVRRHLSDMDFVILVGFCVPPFIALYFMAGRVTMRPPSPGVRLMPKFGCCSQGFIFPSTIVSKVIERTKKAMFEDYYVDMLLERFADAEELARFAHFPSLLQHVGLKSSKGYGFDSHAGEIWNFGFEMYNGR